MSRSALYALGGGAASAFLTIAFAPGVLVGALPLFLAGLSQGTRAGTIACATGFLLVAVLGGPGPAAVYGLAFGVLSLMAIRQTLMRRPSATGTEGWYPIGGVISWLTAAGMGMLTVVGVMLMSEGQDIVTASQTQIDDMAKVMMPDLPDADRETVAARIAPMFPGLACAMWIGIVAANGVLAQLVLVRAGQNARPKGTFGDLSTPGWMSWLLILAAVMALIGTEEVRALGRNLVIVASIPFFVVGLSLVHQVARQTAAPGLLLAVFYLVIVALDWTKMLVAGAGLVEEWFGLRKRIGGPNRNRENE